MYQQATLGGGCFWCTQAIFQNLKGVTKTTAGYSQEAECLQIEFDLKVISYDQLLKVFWATHDPTTPNRQGADVGPQYRSMIFYHSQEQKEKALKSKPKNAVTEIVPFKNFFPAEGYHQDFYNKNPQAAYCQLVINPKLKKLEELLNS
jgi:peptide-methionine (S)-S-oxide reductase